MTQLFKYELKKFIYNKKNIVVVLATLLFLGMFIAYNDYQDQQYPNKMYTEMTNASVYSSKMVKNIETSMKYMEEGTKKEEFKQQKKFWDNLSTSSLILSSGYMKKDYKNEDFVKEQIEWYHLVLDGRKKNYDLDPISRLTIRTIKEQIQKDQYIVDNHIEIMNSPYSCNSLNLFNLLFSDYVGLFIAFPFLLLVFDIVAIEFENSSYKSLYTSNYSRSTILISKTIFIGLLIIAYIAMISSVFFISGFKFGFGNTIYPYAVYPEIYPFYQAVFLMLAIFVMALMSLSAITIFISSWTFSSSVTLVTILSCYMMVIVFQQILDYRWLYPYIPLCYPFNKDIIQYHGTIQSIIIGLAMSFVFIEISIRSLKRKDITV